MGNLIFVGGGSRSGKSRFAVELALRVGKKRIFIATAEAKDIEMQERIRRHHADRADRFLTLECPIEVSDAVVSNGTADVILVDCVSLWLSNLLALGHDDTAILRQIDAFLGSVRGVHADVVVVSNEVGMGLVSLNILGRRFQDLSGFSHQRLADAASEIYLATIGCILRIKPAPVSLVTSG